MMIIHFILYHFPHIHRDIHSVCLIEIGILLSFQSEFSLGKKIQPAENFFEN